MLSLVKRFVTLQRPNVQMTAYCFQLALWSDYVTQECVLLGILLGMNRRIYRRITIMTLTNHLVYFIFWVMILDMVL